MRVNTSEASANCGMAFGLTNEVASISVRPVSLSRSIYRTLSSVEMISSSFCRPSRGPISQTRTNCGMLMLFPVGRAPFEECAQTFLSLGRGALFGDRFGGDVARFAVCRFANARDQFLGSRDRRGTGAQNFGGHALDRHIQRIRNHDF